MPECSYCEEHVSDRWSRIFGIDPAEQELDWKYLEAQDVSDYEDTIIAGCPSCQTTAGTDEEIRKILG